MANAHQTLKAQVDAASHVFMRSHLEKWIAENPDGDLADFLEDCRQREAASKAQLVEVEVENGSTREQALHMTRLMQ